MEKEKEKLKDRWMLINLWKVDIIKIYPKRFLLCNSLRLNWMKGINVFTFLSFHQLARSHCRVVDCAFVRCLLFKKRLHETTLKLSSHMSVKWKSNKNKKAWNILFPSSLFSLSPERIVRSKNNKLFPPFLSCGVNESRCVLQMLIIHGHLEWKNCYLPEINKWILVDASPNCLRPRLACGRSEARIISSTLCFSRIKTAGKKRNSGRAVVKIFRHCLITLNSPAKFPQFNSRTFVSQAERLERRIIKKII